VVLLLLLVGVRFSLLRADVCESGLVLDLLLLLLLWELSVDTSSKRYNILDFNIFSRKWYMLL
jgi:hypothetical protein